MMVITHEMVCAFIGFCCTSLAILVYLEANASKDSPEWDRDQWEQERIDFENQLEREQWIEENCPCDE